jgi:glutamine amidotransferase
MLTYLPAGVQPNPAALAAGAAPNPHGHGYAVVTAGGIAVGKSFDFEEALERFTLVRTENPDGPALFHSRFRAHGKKSRANIHPFNVGGQGSTVLAHDGILPASAQPGRRQTKSDSRIFAEDLLGATIPARFDNSDARRSLEHWIGPWNKVVVLTIGPQYEQQAYVFNQNVGIWNGSTWYSNRDFETDETQVAGGFSTACLACENFGTADPDGACKVCGSCGECATSRS